MAQHESDRMATTDLVGELPTEAPIGESPIEEDSVVEPPLKVARAEVSEGHANLTEFQQLLEQLKSCSLEKDGYPTDHGSWRCCWPLLQHLHLGGSWIRNVQFLPILSLIVHLYTGIVDQ